MSVIHKLWCRQSSLIATASQRIRSSQLHYGITPSATAIRGRTLLPSSVNEKRGNSRVTTMQNASESQKPCGNIETHYILDASFAVQPWCLITNIQPIENIYSPQIRISRTCRQMAGLSLPRNQRSAVNASARKMMRSFKLKITWISA
jgi:hypothetical protein